MNNQVRESIPAYGAAPKEWPQFAQSGRPVAAWAYYKIQHLPRIEFMQPARNALPAEDAEMIIRHLTEHFKNRGWDGHGAIDALWLPPFAAEQTDDQPGLVVFHVRHGDKTFSLLASPQRLPGLSDQQRVHWK